MQLLASHLFEVDVVIVVGAFGLLIFAERIGLGTKVGGS